jgi:hypothetical protein
MGTKQKPSPFDCYAAALPDEPMFVLLARDPSSPVMVRRWADIRAGIIARGARPGSDMAQVAEARRCATDMEEWRALKIAQAPDPRFPAWRDHRAPAGREITEVKLAQEIRDDWSSECGNPRASIGERAVLARIAARAAMRELGTEADAPERPLLTAADLEKARVNLALIGELDAMFWHGGPVTLGSEVFRLAERRRLAALIPPGICIPPEPTRESA